MKTLRSLTSALSLAVAAALVAVVSGCAGTATSRSTGEFVDDTGLSAKVKTALFQDPVVSGFDVGIDVFRGHVQLNGFVDTPEQKARAEQVVRSVEGVTGVGNKLTVKTTTNPSAAAQTGQRAQGAQRSSSQTGANDATRVEQPAATGRESTDAARNQDPVVQSAARAVRQIWDANPELRNQNLRVTAENGRLVFNGSVPNTELWERARDSAEGVVRGIEIVNHISINSGTR